MLQRLEIKNYALIDEVEIDFSDGLSIITGETGAGKSIMLGALGLLLGGRAETRMMADKSRKTIVEAEFSKPEGLILRREIAPNGRSRAFIDDTPATLQELRDASASLLDIHSQHSNLNLTTKEGQLEVVDAMSDSAEALAEYRKIFKTYLEKRRRLREMKDAKASYEERRELILYQIEQLNKLAPKRGELQKVERRFELLSEADEIKEHLSASHYFLDGGEGSALDRLVEAAEALEGMNMETIDPDAGTEDALSARLKSLRVELKDIADIIGRIGSEVESNPAKLEATSKRMRELLDAIHTFKVADTDELCDLHDELLAQFADMNGDGSDIILAEKELRRLARDLKQQADRLSDIREAGAAEFSNRLTQLANPLGLPNVKFEVRNSRGKLGPEGQDTPEFYVTFNKNAEVQPMAKTASGGELSRLTLCIKSMLAEKMNMPTVIFDEIDTGVSGEIADKMGGMMDQMGERMQIIAITHLPQVAAKGEHHYKVYKRDTAERTLSGVKMLSAEEREREIAAMISGSEVTDAALKAARALLKH